MKTYLLEEMTWPEIREAMEKGVDTVIIFAASIEQHGPGLPENTDTLIGYAEAVGIAERLGNALVAPVIRPGLSRHHLCLPGSLTFRPETFRMVVEDYVAAYVHHGFKKLILGSSHGGNFETLDAVAEEQSRKYPEVKIITALSHDDLHQIFLDAERSEDLPAGTCGGHACDWETSVMLTLGEDLVRRDKLQCGHVGVISDELRKHFFEDGVSYVSPIGVLGDPTHADRARGERYFSHLMEVCLASIRKKLTE